MPFRILMILAMSELAVFVPLSMVMGDTAADNPPLPSSINPSSPSKSTPKSDALPPETHKQIIINEMNVIKLSGTIMVDHIDKTASTALQTGSIVEKGDVITVYDNSWVILKTHRGDQIGLDGNTVATLDECYMEGPDRQIRFLVQKGTLFLRTNNADSRQSFFEINTGNVVTSINSLEGIISYDPAKNFLDVKYIHGKIHVIDQDHEENFRQQQTEYNGYTKSETNSEDLGEPLEHTEHTWLNGKMVQEDPVPLEELDEINFRKFFDGEKRIIPDDNNMLLNDTQNVPVRQQ